MVEKIKRKKRRKILVTGSSGMLGTELCPELAKEYTVIGLDILDLPVSNVKASARTAFIKCDITDKKKTVASIIDAKPDLIIHVAAWTDVDGCEKDPAKAKKVNVRGTANVAYAAKKLDIPLVYISTDFVFDGKKNTPYTEKETPHPLSVYSKSKLEGEKRIRKLDRYLIVRSSWLFGNNGDNFVDTILKKAKKERILHVVDDQIGSPTYTKDLAIAIRRLLHAVRSTRYAVRDLYHVSNNGAVSWFGYAKEILKIAAVNSVKVIPIKSSELDRPARRPAFSVLDNTKFEKLTGYVMRNWRNALKEYLSS